MISSAEHGSARVGRWRIVIFSLICLGLLIGGLPVRAAELNGETRQALEMNCTNATLPYINPFMIPLCTSSPLDQPNPNIQRAFIVVNPGIHSVGSIPQIVSDAGLDGESIIIVPSFPEGSSSDPEKVLYWGPDWRFGGDAVNGQLLGPTSSFHIIDDILTQLANPDVFPNLTKVVIMGFSAGGQFVNRYSVFTPMPIFHEAMTNQRLQFRFIVGAPSIYVYMDNFRWDAQSQSFKPFSDTACPANFYPWGLDGIADANIYLFGLSPSDAQIHFPFRDIYYITGGDDTIRDESLAMGCASDAQGMNRVERAQNYHRHLTSFFADGAPHHKLFIIPGIGHSDAIYNSEQGRAALFDNWSRDSSYTIMGRILDSKGVPVSGAAVTLNSGAFNTTTNEHGVYAFTGLGSGDYNVVPSKDDLTFTPSNYNITITRNSAGAQDFVVQAKLNPQFLIPLLGQMPRIFQPGSGIDLFVKEFPPGSTVEILVNGDLLGTVQIAQDGWAEIPIKIPANAQAGWYFLSARNEQYATGMRYQISPNGFQMQVANPRYTVPENVTPAHLLNLPLITR